MALATRSGSRISVWMGLDDSGRTRRPDGWADASSKKGTTGPPSSSSRQVSTTVGTPSIPSEMLTWPVTVSASTSRTRWPLWTSIADRLVAIIVLPTPPLGLNTAISWPRRLQSDASSSPCRTGPEPSSTATDRMHMASTRQRMDSAEYGRVRYSSSSWPSPMKFRASRVAGLTIRSAGIERPFEWSSVQASSTRSASTSASMIPTATSGRVASRAASSRTPSSGIGLKPPAWSSATTGSRSAFGSRSATTGRPCDVDIRVSPPPRDRGR